MKARFALYMGDYKVAAEAAKACMDLGIYSLEPDYAKLFKQSTKVNSEKIFVIPRSIVNDVILDSWIVKNSLPRNAGGYGSYNPSWDLFASYLCTDGLPIDESPLFDPHNPFKNRDPRCAMSIVEFNTKHCGFDYDPSPAAKTVMNYTTGKTQANQDTRIVNQYSSYTGLLWKKGIDDSWIKGSPKTYTSGFALSGVSAGQYTWAVGIVDSTKDNAIGIYISARDEYQTPDGWVKLSDITVK